MEVYKIKKSIMPLFFAFLLLFFLSACSDENTNQINNIGNNLSTKTPYPNPDQTQYTDPPEGCIPIFINHVGRHGSRNLTKDKAYKNLLAEVNAASQSGDLTGEFGPQVEGWLKDIKKHEDPVLGDLTSQGKDELKAMAIRMYENYKTLLNLASPIKPIYTQCTYKQRAIDSRTAFQEGLKEKADEGFDPKAIDEQPPSKKCHDPLLRFFEMCTSYTDFLDTDPCASLYDQFVSLSETQAAFKTILERVFSKKLVDSKTPHEIDTLIQYMYELCQLEADIDKDDYLKRFCLLFYDVDSDAIQRLAYLADIYYFFRQGPNPGNDNKSYKYSCPLVRDFILTTNKAISEPQTAPTANLRFGHAETVMPFASFLGLYINAASEKLSFSTDRAWNTSKLCAMATNVQIILYKCEDSYKVKVLLNENEVVLPIPACQDVYCNWQDVEAYYTNLTASLGLLTCTFQEWEGKTICDGSSCQ